MRTNQELCDEPRDNWRRPGLSAIRLSVLTVLIETKNDERALALTLASLVGGAVAGVVRQVIVCNLGATDQTQFVAEHAGCNYIASGGVAAGIRQAKGEWLLLLEPGARLADGWVDDVVAYTEGFTMPARFSPARESRGSFLSRAFSRNRALAEGLVITKRQAAALARNAGSAEAIARGLAAKKLKAEIWPAPREKG